MNPRLAHLLMRLYPSSWRERYGAEFETLLQTGRSDFSTSANVVWSALCERIVPTRELKVDRNARVFQFHSWCVRAPWAMYGLVPLLLLAGAYFVACFILWSGWKIFLPEADTPFGGGPIDGFANFYFQAGRAYYFAAPILIGWVIGLIAALQKVKAVWPTVGLVLIAWMGGTAQIQASRTAVPGGLGHISMEFGLGRSVQDNLNGLSHALVILSLTILPYLIWRFKKARSVSA